MKKIFLVALTILLGLWYFNKDAVAKHTNQILYHSPCESPITYRIGDIDPKFNMTSQDLLTSTEKAGNIWSTAEEKNLFKFDPKGDVSINLVYDERQSLNSQITELDSMVKKQQKSLDPEIADYQRRASEFQSRLEALNRDIDYWNSQGGAPPDEYNSLKVRQENLRNEAISLQQEARSLNQSTDQYNTQVGELRETVNSFNQTLSQKPEEGEYIVDHGVQKINIYFASSETELVHTLTHEFGHALGIGHNNNPQSIMFPKTNQSVALSTDDLFALSKACEEKNVLTTTFENLALLFRKTRENLK